MMPNSRSSTKRRDAANDAAVTLSPIELVRQHADALLRAALECCHQHDRFAKLYDRAPVDGEEHVADKLCQACEESLSNMVAGYERIAASIHPDGEEVWWRKANAMWMAAREYARRNAGCDEATRRLSHHAPSDLTKLHTEFELQASALLAMRHACEEYRRLRPNAA
jgi:hypothetical protein